MKRRSSPVRVLVIAVCGMLVSCTSALRMQVPRTETVLTEREKRRLAATLDDMAAGWDGMQSGRAADRRKAQDRYQRALAGFLRDWDRQQSPRYWQDGVVFATKQHAFRIEFDPRSDARTEVPPSKIDEIILPSRLKPLVTDTLARRPGVGVPFVGHIRRTSEVTKEQPFLPPNGGNLTLTAMMDLQEKPADTATPRVCRLHLHNALNVDTVKVQGDERLLAANFTAAKSLALSRKSLTIFSWLGILFPERTLKSCQLYQMDFYDPQRIPVVFVHGLMSSPRIWLNMVNAINADPELRAVYQPWYFLYPSALDIPQASSRLRESLREALRHDDPDHNDPGPQKMVLVGHSMGGLLSRMQVIDPKDKLWNAMFDRPPQELRVSDAVRQRLMTDLMFKPLPEIKRLIFIATPHRGSDLASKNIVRHMTSIIRLPIDTVFLSRELLRGNTDALSPEIRGWGPYAFLSVGMLSKKHPFFKGLNALPIPVKHHSIIGILGKNHGVNGSDAVVPYWSAHLDTAESEKIVPHWHSSVERPEVVKEVVRVLHEHLRENGLPAKKRS
ncbi:MAG: alpha/beta fold hydrolase [Verrucomicrobiaceae bacterium]